jgi:nucleoside-diphosphate-sugar epimerase
MKLVIFGATGRTGRHLLEQARQAGHQVTAIVRDPDRLPTPIPQGLRVLAADVMNPAAIAPAIAGADAVITAIAPPGGRAPSTVGPDSARSIIQAMREVGARRLVAITGSMVDDTGPFFRNDATRKTVEEWNLAFTSSRGAPGPPPSPAPASTVLLPREGERTDYAIINHCRWDHFWDFMPSIAFKRSFRNYVLANFSANNVSPRAIIYRLA